MIFWVFSYFRPLNIDRLYILYIRSVIIFLFLNASLRSVYVLFSVLLWSRVIRCFHNIAFLRNKVFVFFPRSKCFDRLRQASTGFDRRRAHLTPPSSRENSLTEIVLRHCVSIFVLETLLFLVIPLLRSTYIVSS